MARSPYAGVPDTEPSLEAPGVFQRIDASPAAFGGAIAEGGGAVGQGVERLADAQVQTQILGASNALADHASQAQQQFRSLQGQNAIDAFPQFREDMEAQQKEIEESLPTLQARNDFVANSRRFVQGALDSAGEHVGEQTLKLQDETAQGAIQATRNFAVTNRNQPGVLPQSIAQISAQTARYMTDVKGVQDPDAIHAAVQQQVGSMLGETIQASLYEGQTLPEQQKALQNAKDMYDEAMRSTIPGSPNVPMLTGADVEKLGQTINYREWTLSQRQDRQTEEAAANSRVAVHSQLDNATAMVERGLQVHGPLPTPEQIDAAYPNRPEEASLVKDQVEDLQTMSSYLGVVPLATPQQIADLKLKAQPDPDHPETFAKQARISAALDHVLDQRTKMLASDPATYMIGASPDLQRSFANAQQNPASFEQYAHDMQAAQITAGLRPDQVGVLPAPSAKSLVQDIEGNAEAAPQKMRQLQQQYGSSWPQVWRDLSQRGGMSPQYQAVGIIDPGSGALLARALAEPEKAGKDISDLIPKGAGGKNQVTVIENAVKTGATQQLVRSVLASGGSAAQAATIESSVKTLAMANMVYKGMDGAAAITAATKAFTGQYRFVPDGGARVPADKYDTVMQNARHMLDGLNPGRLQLPGNQSADAVHAAFLGQESGNRSSIGTSVDGAVGPGQMVPATFQKFAQPGEKITDPDTNRAVSARAIDHYLQEYGGDTSRAAVAYFSGEGNVAPAGSPHPWKQDYADGNGKHVSAYTADIQKRLGGGIFNQLGGPSGDDYVRSLRAAPSWITSPNADGLWLMDHYGRVVRNADGSPVAVPFAAPPAPGPTRVATGARPAESYSYMTGGGR